LRYQKHLAPLYFVLFAFIKEIYFYPEKLDNLAILFIYVTGVVIYTVGIPLVLCLIIYWIKKKYPHQVFIIAAGIMMAISTFGDYYLAESAKSAGDSTPIKQEAKQLNQEALEVVNPKLFKDYMLTYGYSLSLESINPKIESIIPEKNSYTNNFIGLTIDFPNNWTLDRGASSATLIRAVMMDSAASLAVLANPIEDGDSKGSGIGVSMLEDLQRLHGSYQSYFDQEIRARIGVNVDSIFYEEKRFGSHKYLYSGYTYLEYYDDMPIPMMVCSMQTSTWGRVITIAYNCPEMFFNEDTYFSTISSISYVSPEIRLRLAN
jgi:hypothetical protein